jgi:DNA-binding CsgD family transcriptional regulator
VSPRLSGRQAATALKFLDGLYAVTELGAFQAYVAAQLRCLAKADYASYNEINLLLPRNSWSCDPEGVTRFPGCDAIFARYMRENPNIAHFSRTGERGWRKISDFLTRAEFHRTNLYNEFYRRIPTEHQVATMFPASTGGYVGIALNRSRRDFDEHQRQQLDLLLPHLMHAYHNVTRFTEVRGQISALHRGVDAAGVGVIGLTADRRVQLLTRLAEQWLERYFPGQPTTGGRLPETLRLWVNRHGRDLRRAGEMPPAREPMVVDRQDTRLTIHMVGQGAGLFLLLSERQTEMPLHPLEALGLSRREAEVLKWVAEGKRDGEIAMILGISCRTIHHHLESVYRKLGVETRTAAAAHALSATGCPASASG